jgi:hypothetical protein
LKKRSATKKPPSGPSLEYIELRDRRELAVRTALNRLYDDKKLMNTDKYLILLGATARTTEMLMAMERDRGFSLMEAVRTARSVVDEMQKRNPHA